MKRPTTALLAWSAFGLIVDETELERLSAERQHVIQETVQQQQESAWIRKQQGRRES